MIVSLIWLLIYAIALCLVVWVIFWVLRDFMGVSIPDKVEKGIWLIVFLIILAWLVTSLIGAGGPPFRLSGITGSALAAISFGPTAYLSRLLG